jgi:hypothetical protein
MLPHSIYITGKFAASMFKVVQGEGRWWLHSRTLAHTYSLQNVGTQVQSTERWHTRTVYRTKAHTYSLQNVGTHVQSTERWHTRTVYRTLTHTYSLQNVGTHVQSTPCHLQLDEIHRTLETVCDCEKWNGAKIQ